MVKRKGTAHVHDRKLEVSTEAKDFVVLGAHGWLYWCVRDFHDVRIEVAEQFGRIEVVSVYVHAVPPAQPPLASSLGTSVSVRPADLRAVPLGRLEGFLNDPDVKNQVTASLASDSGLDLRPGNLSTDEVLAATDALSTVSAPPVELRLEGLDTKPRTDDFYRQVAAVWSRAGAGREGREGLATAIMKANGLESTSPIHAWVREARKRGLMPPSSRSTRKGTTGQEPLVDLPET